MQSQNDIFIKMAFDAWNKELKTAIEIFETLSDDQLDSEIAPEKNTGTYLLGHLTAVNDNMFSILGLGEKLHPELYEIYIKNPDKSSLPKPSIDQLRKYWKEINA